MNDFLLSKHGDLAIEKGDWLMTNSHHQHIESLLMSVPGEWKENPTTGAGLNLLKNGIIDGFTKRTIAIQLEADGFELDNLEITESGLIIDAKRL